MIQAIESNGTSLAHPKPNKAVHLDHWSASSVKDYLGCSLRYFFKRVEGLPETPSANLHLGSAVHHALQAHYRNRWRGNPHDSELVLSAFEDAFGSEDPELPVPWKPGEWETKRELGRKMVDAYLDSDHTRSERPVVAVEVALREKMGPVRTDMVGQVDLVLGAGDGGLVPVDFKTIANTPNVEMEAFQHELQMVLYQLMVENATGGKVSSREIVFITKHKTPKVIVHSMPRATNAQIERFWRMVERAEEGVLRGEWAPQPAMHCAWCSFRKECAQWTGKEVSHD